MTRYTHCLAYTSFPDISRQRNFHLRFIILSDVAAYQLLLHNQCRWFVRTQTAGGSDISINWKNRTGSLACQYIINQYPHPSIMINPKKATSSGSLFVCYSGNTYFFFGAPGVVASGMSLIFNFTFTASRILSPGKA